MATFSNAAYGYGGTYGGFGGFPQTFHSSSGLGYGGYTGLAGGGYAPAYAGSYGFDLGRRYGYGNSYGLPYGNVSGPAGNSAFYQGTYASPFAGGAVPTWGGYGGYGGYGASTVAGPVANTVSPFSPVGFNPGAAPLGLPAPPVPGAPAAVPASQIQAEIASAATTAAVAANQQTNFAVQRQQEAALSVLRKFPQFPVGSGPKLATANPPPPPVPVFAPTVTAATVTAAPFAAAPFTPFW